MLENLFNLVKQQAGEAVINNPAIPDQRNEGAVQVIPVDYAYFSRH